VIGRRYNLLRRNRRGFTLLEVLLTLFVLVVLAALTWPALANSFARYRLRAAADQVRAQWVSARVKAMQTDSVQIFRYTPGGNEYSVQRRNVMEAVVDPSTGDSTGVTGDTPDPAPGSATKETLPDGITFAGSETAPDTRAATVDTSADQSPTSAPDWADPVLFYPDGTTSTARLVLRSDRGLGLELSLRGLTGVVTVGEIITTQEGLP
jgi:prepilin-type N-terminal cleavage/methylation domain-containing protein